MKKIKIFFFTLCLFGVTATVISADSRNIGHNSGETYLQYGSASAECYDTPSLHTYWTTGFASNYSNARLAVYVKDASGLTVASGSSSKYSMYASAKWEKSVSTTHFHSASSSLIY